MLGGGPGGYTAAFRAADLGLSVALIDRGEQLGGVCLNVGCIPSKALLHVAKVLTEAHELGEAGISFGEPSIDVDKVREWKNGVVGKLTGGLEGLAKQRKVQVVRGSGTFTGPNTIEVGDTVVGFEHCIIAAGSEAASLPFLPDDPRIVDSTGALEVEGIPERLLVIGGGIIGLEMATVYDALGSKVTVVELLDQLIPGVDKDLIKVLEKRVKGRYEAIHLSTGVESVEATDDGLVVKFGDSTETFDRSSSRWGASPTARVIGADAAGVSVDERGYIASDLQMRTNVPHIFSIGDVRGEPMLAHKATHEGSLAAEVIAGEDVSWDARSIPSVAYTDPEVAWTGLTETQAKAEEREVETAMFPWAASGRALSMGRSDGLTKLVLEPDTRRVLGAGIVGVNAGELLAEAVLAIEAGPGRRGHRADDPRAPDAVGDRRLRGRDGRGHDHRPDAQAQAREGVSYRPPDPGVAPRFTGIRTFARAPHVASADGVDAAIVGVPFDTATSMRPGARFGPAGIRDASLLLRPWNTAQQVDVFALSLADLGDLATTPGNALRTTEQIAEQLEPVIRAGAVPLVLGGDHSIVLGELRAHAAVHGPLAVVLLDAHADTWEEYWGERYFHGTPFKRAMEEGLIDPSRSLLAGMRGSLYAASDLDEPRSWGFEIVSCDELRTWTPAEYPPRSARGWATGRPS